MKKNMYWFMMVAAIVMSAMTFVSCEDPFEPELPEVIESEVLESGADETIEEAVVSDDSGVSGTELSYKSWIRVKGQTRADFDHEVSVTLNNTFIDPTPTIVVEDLNIGEYTTNISHRAKESRQEGFVTITDSVLVYTVQYEKVSFEYELEYEVAVYDDGFTRQVMPYHGIDKVTEKSYKTYLIESDDDGELAYARRKVEHSILVEVNGKSYEVKANVFLRKHIGYAKDPYVKWSELVDTKLDMFNGQVRSTVTVFQKWNRGAEETLDYTVFLSAGIDNVSYGDITAHGYNNDLKVVSTSLTNGENNFEPSNKTSFIVYENVRKVWNINYNYGSVSIELGYTDAWFDDGVTQCKFANYELTEITNLEPRIVPGDAGVDEVGNYQVYWVHQPVQAKFGGITAEGTVTFMLIAYE
ncbi:MAG: hypothetical protein IKV11_00985 [Alphaproteobacteria bacterium]|nr:hypothetical protein [Alphaproteobacteria bacterium]